MCSLFIHTNLVSFLSVVIVWKGLSQNFFSRSIDIANLELWHNINGKYKYIYKSIFKA